MRLAQNLQGDIASQTRTECINRVAEQIAREKADAFVTWQELKNYMLGINAQALTKIGHWTPEQKDVLAFLKDQFYTNLPLTLGQSGISKYQRSKDGKRIITCVQGEPKEAKFGNIIEEINYSIQEYLQHRVAFPTVRGWVIDAIRDFKNRVEGAEQRFREIVPTVALDQLARLSPDDLDDRIERELLPAINQRTNAVEFFLRRHLAGLRSSGFVASMNPQDAVAMSRIVAGVSATAGSLGSLHSQFQTNQNEATRIQEEMIARLRRRALGQPITYDPVNPMAILNRPFPAPLTAIIDGSGMFRENSSRSVAEALLRSNPALRKVEYYENSGALNYVGQELVPLEAKGFYFSQAYTRGADQRLRPDAVALLTVCEQGRMEDLSQQEGRMRENGQRIIVAVSQFAPVEMRTLNGIIDRKRQNEQDLNAEELFRAEAQRLRQTLRTTTKKTLLNIDEINQFLTAFDSAQGVFIQQTSPEYANRGDYFNRHQAITPRNCDPLEELQALKQSLIEQSALLGISPLPLQQINYSEALRARLPQQVSPLGTVESQQLEVEEEVEEQVEFEVEMELEEEQESQTTRITAGPKVASYLRRQPSETFYSAAERMHPAFDPKIEFSSAFLPLERRDILHRRVPFDDRMSRIGVIRVFFDSSTNETIQLGIGDLLYNIDSPRNEVQPTPNLESFLYDTRTARITWTSENDAPYAEIINRPEFKSQVAQIRFMDGQIDRYAHEDLTHLSAWLQIDNRAQQMRHFFEQKILQHRSEVRARYQHSQLWNLFEQLGTRTTIRTF